MTDESLPEYFLNNFDVELQEFYHRVISKELSLNTMSNVHGINRTLRELDDAYKDDIRRFICTSISYNSRWKRCAYVIKHSTCFTTAVASYLLKLLNINKKILRESLRNGEVNICCLGGGPATDAVAIIKIVRGLYYPQWLQSKKKLKIHVTVIDLSENWHETAKNVFHCLEDTPEFFGVNEISLSYGFIQANLAMPMIDEVKDAIKSADLLTLIYFLSAVNGSKDKEKSLPMMQNIMLNMQKGACLFFLDSAEDLHYELLNKAAKKWRSMQEIYGPFVEELYTISLESVTKFIELYSKHFSKFSCKTDIFICVSSWYKLKTIQSRISLKEGVALRPIEWAKPTQEESYQLKEKMVAYRANVERLVTSKYSKIEKREVSEIKRLPYAVVSFPENDSMFVVPRIWLLEQIPNLDLFECRWPIENFHKASKNLKLPEDHWKCVNIRVLRYSRTYESANKYAEKHKDRCTTKQLSSECKELPSQKRLQENSELVLPTLDGKCINKSTTIAQLRRLEAKVDGLLKNIAEIKEEQKGQAASLRKLQQLYLHLEKNEVLNEFKCLKSVNEMEEFEVGLSKEEEFVNAVKKCRSLGGKDAKEAVIRILEKVLDHNLAISVSWSEENGKIPLRNFPNFLRLVTASLHSNVEYKDVSLSFVKGVIKRWLCCTSY